jgi:hypothetical protein
MTINSSLFLFSGGTNIMEINKAAGTNDSIIGMSSVAYGGTLIVTNLAGTLAAGDSFTLFGASSYSGVFDTFILPPLSGGLFWNTNSLLVDGTLKVAGPRIDSISVTGSSISLGGSGGPALHDYYILTSTNVVLPLTSWTSIATNQFDSNGNFNFTSTLNPSEPQRFYSFQVPLP